MKIEVVKRNGPKIGLHYQGSLMIDLSIDEATTLMVHLGAVIDWAVWKDEDIKLKQMVAESNADLTGKQKPEKEVSNER